MNKTFIINKPLEWTSMDVIAKMRNILGMKKIGHAGTLDPLATGVLIVCTGTMTKKINEFMDMKKEYEAEIDLTAFSHTDDAQGPLHPVEVTKAPTMQEIETVLATFIGTTTQIPPKFSAIKINGKRAYKKAHNKEEFIMPPRQVTIYDISIISYQWPKLSITVSCAKGTYIRSLARDIGKKLQTGGYLSGLIRTSIGQYTIQDAITLEQLAEQFRQN